MMLAPHRRQERIVKGVAFPHFNGILVEAEEDALSPRFSTTGTQLVRERKWSTRRVGAVIGRSQTFVSRRLRVYEDRVLRGLMLNQRLSGSGGRGIVGGRTERTCCPGTPGY